MNAGRGCGRIPRMNTLGFCERELSYEVQIDTSMFNGDGAATLPALQLMVIRGIMAHLSRLDMDAPALKKRFGVSWVMLSMSLELVRPVERSDRLHLHTWNAESKAPVYRREAVLHDEAGGLVLRAAERFAVLDLGTRRLSSNREAHDYCHSLPAGETLMVAAGRRPDLPERLPLIETRTVRPSWIDGLGHMNNVRYGELVYDALPEARARMRELRRADVWFMHELREGDRVLMESDGAVAARGTREGDELPCFAARLTF